jgi:hypothetical protein
MSVHTFTRAASLAVVGTLLATVTAFADTMVADGDALTAGTQATVDLGQVAPGASISIDVGFTLTCSGTRHVNSNQFVALGFTAIVPADGGATGTDVTVAPPGSGWPVDFADCTNAPQPIQAGPSHVTITAPTVAGNDYSFLLMWTRTLLPSAANDSQTFTGATSLTVIVDVVNNTPPHLIAPADQTVEGNTTGGATVSYNASAADAEDEPDPTPVCAPASGSLFALGTTTVSCQVTDSGGLGDSATFDVTVVDTTAPALDAVGSINVTTTDATGDAVSYPTPGASDIVDSSPTVDCLPASGSTFPLGDTTVTCTASDDSGNQSSGSFVVHVAFDEPTQWSVIWDEPVGDGAHLATSGERSIPVKVRVFHDGVEVKLGSPRLEVSSCDGGPAIRTVALDWSGGRWFGHLDASGLPGGCYRVAVTVGDTAAGSFVLEVLTSSTSSSTRNTTRVAAREDVTTSKNAVKVRKETKADSKPKR